MEYKFKQELVNSFLAIGRSIGAGLATIGLAGAGVGVILFGLLFFSFPNKVFCATPVALDATRRLVESLTPEQLERFNERMEVIDPLGPSFLQSVLIAIGINVAVITIVWYGPLIWNTLVTIVQGTWQGLGVAAGAIARRHLENAEQDPQLMLQMQEILVEIVQQTGNTGGAATL